MIVTAFLSSVCSPLGNYGILGVLGAPQCRRVLSYAQVSL